MGVALMTMVGGGHSLDCRVFLIRGANADTNSGCGVVWLWSCVVVEYALRWAVSEVSKL